HRQLAEPQAVSRRQADAALRRGAGEVGERQAGRAHPIGGEPFEDQRPAGSAELVGGDQRRTGTAGVGGGGQGDGEQTDGGTTLDGSPCGGVGRYVERRTVRGRIFVEGGIVAYQTTESYPDALGHAECWQLSPHPGLARILI